MTEQSTIAAIATGPARGGIGVLRISGPRAIEAARHVVPRLRAMPVARHAYFLPFMDAAGTVVDEGVAIYFQAPASFTGEEVVELHAHGSPRLLRLLLETVTAVSGVRVAEPGEFTRRAFLNGRIDLARAEAVADLIAADSEAAVRAAASQLVGALSEQLSSVRLPLVELHADLEASLDFPEESEGVEVETATRLAAALQGLNRLREQGRQGSLFRRGAQVVLYGAVNSGKSTLFNALVGSERALVDETPGTTRDALEARLEWSGLSVTLVDTAGLRAAPERLEALGIERTHRALGAADLAVLLLSPDSTPSEVSEWRRAVPDETRIEVYGKADLRQAPEGSMGISGKSGAGVAALQARILCALGYHRAEAVGLSSARHLDALDRAVDALNRAVTAHQMSTVEIVAGETGIALRLLAEITGEDARGELLDAVFRRFCIGK